MAYRATILGRALAPALAIALAGLAGVRAEPAASDWQLGAIALHDVAQARADAREIPIALMPVSELFGDDAHGDVAFGRAVLSLDQPRLVRAAPYAPVAAPPRPPMTPSAALGDVLRRPAFVEIAEGALSFSLTAEPPAEGAPASGGAGALVRFGEDLAGSSDADARGWYMFAGADAQALTWTLGEAARESGALRFEDVAMVGDAQAGVGFRLGAGDLTFGVIHREIRHAEASAEERFGGVSFVVSH